MYITFLIFVFQQFTSTLPPPKDKILDANLAVHNREARFFETIHTEIFNSFEQSRIFQTLKSITKLFHENSKILDVGAGTGNIANKLISLGFKNIICVDISRQMLNQLLMKTSLDSESTVCSDIDTWLNENKSKKFDIIILSSVLHHLPHYQNTLEKLLNHLNDEGILLITHEPLRENDGSISLCILLTFFIRNLDYSLYIVRYLFLVITGKLKHLNIDYYYSDYWDTGNRSIRLKDVTNIAEKYIYDINLYSVAKFAFAAKFLTKYDKNAFELIIHKKKKSS